MERSPSSMVKAVDRALCAPHLLGYLRWGEPDDMAHNHHVALLVWQDGERRVQVSGSIARLFVGVLVGSEDLFGGRGTTPAEVVERDVASETQQPT